MNTCKVKTPCPRQAPYMWQMPSLEPGRTLNPMLSPKTRSKHLGFHADPNKIGRGKAVPSATDILLTVPLATGFLVPFFSLLWKSGCLFPGSVWTGKSWLTEEGLRLPLPPILPPTVQMLLHWQSVVHLDALLQLSSQSSQLCHQVAQDIT